MAFLVQFLLSLPLLGPEISLWNISLCHSALKGPGALLRKGLAPLCPGALMRNLPGSREETMGAWVQKLGQAEAEDVGVMGDAYRQVKSIL